LTVNSRNGCAKKGSDAFILSKCRQKVPIIISQKRKISSVSASSKGSIFTIRSPLVISSLHVNATHVHRE
jgi:hypothetical protein